jgi:hypothetical protein
MAVLSAMSIMTAMIMVAVGAMILSFVTIDIEQAIPTHIEVMAIMAAQVPTMKFIMTTQPVRITVSVSYDIVSVVSSVVTPMC